jgi:YVTN family beta-propeller protein
MIHIFYSLFLSIVFDIFTFSKVAHAQFVETTIKLPSPASARDLLYNPISNKIYTGNTPDAGMPAMRSVTIIDGSTNSVITTIQMPEGPRDFCLNQKSNKVYVACYFADSVAVIDGVTNALLRTIPVGDGPRALCYSTVSDKVYCINEMSGNVTVINGTTDAVITTLKVGSTPRVVAYNPTNDKIYVPNAGSRNLSIIDGASNTIQATVTTGNTPRGIAYNPISNAIYCSNYSSDNVTVIDGASNQVKATVTVGDGPTAIFHVPQGNKMYCSNVGSPGPDTPDSCTVSVIDAATNTLLKTLPAGDEPTAFSYNPRTKKVLWVNEWSHDISVIDAITDKLTKVISIGKPPVQPVDMCYNSVNERFYVANRLTYDISVIKDTMTTDTVPSDCSNSTIIVPSKLLLKRGESVTLTVSTKDPNPTYVWQSDFGLGFQTLLNSSGISGVTTSKLIISNVQIANHRQPFRVITTSGICIDTSDVVNIVISDSCIVSKIIIDSQITTIRSTDTLVVDIKATSVVDKSMPPGTIRIYPNPASEMLMIECTDELIGQNYTLNISNILGQIVHSSAIYLGTVNIKTNDWSSTGTYHVSIIDSSGHVISSTMITIQ